MLYYLLEDNMKRYAWHQTYLHSLREEMRKKHVAITEIHSPEDIPSADEEPFLLLLGVSDTWVNRLIEVARRRGITKKAIALTSARSPGTATKRWNLPTGISRASDGSASPYTA